MKSKLILEIDVFTDNYSLTQQIITFNFPEFPAISPEIRMPDSGVPSKVAVHIPAKNNEKLLIRLLNSNKTEFPHLTIKGINQKGADFSYKFNEVILVGLTLNSEQNSFACEFNFTGFIYEFSAMTK